MTQIFTFLFVSLSLQISSPLCSVSQQCCLIGPVLFTLVQGFKKKSLLKFTCGEGLVIEKLNHKLIVQQKICPMQITFDSHFLLVLDLPSEKFCYWKLHIYMWMWVLYPTKRNFIIKEFQRERESIGHTVHKTISLQWSSVPEEKGLLL
jgi:hypothetical protein